MKKSKIQERIEILKQVGWISLGVSEVRINGRYYKYCKMKKDNEMITVNHRGGTEGLVSTLK